MPQYGSDSLNQRLNIEWMIVKIVDGALRSSPCGRSPVCLIRGAPPFLQAAQCRSVRIVRIERQQDDFSQLPSLAQRVHRFRRKRMPVTHRRDCHRIDVRRNSLHQSNSLPLRERSDRRTSADFCVALSDGNRPPRRNKPGNRAPQQSEGTERDNVGVQKQIQQKRLDGLQRIRPAALKQYNPDSLLHCPATCSGSAYSSSVQFVRLAPPSAAPP